MSKGCPCCGVACVKCGAGTHLFEFIGWVCEPCRMQMWALQRAHPTATRGDVRQMMGVAPSVRR